ncbi:hypothetical protein [Acidibrevibacterium fodinaquatile]|jgi:hypothetical protein|uniref:hypothetical protein n=1 Tax=Acidibrevibacterium fodinaquatile TaxID=1969806 RepID=UPI000E0CFDEA|nr:hypothetical protein [Acidibrevibacterium fodinaquatile]
MLSGDSLMSLLCRRAGALAAVFALGACTIPFGGPNLPPAPHQPSAVSLFDGSYQGKVRAVGANAADCPKSGYGVAEIGDATLTLPYRPGVIFTVPVAADGTLHQTVEGTRIEGRAAQNQLTLLVSSGACQTRYRLSYVWNHS